ncbi:MAG: 2-phosphosulfolactate phosphatase [Synergistaceae bacterium]|jgi:2-phosphosulfolactate phosphatase|nr:2-phosphosulfolactate phosphatase [Synergistaceae bacterium]
MAGTSKSVQVVLSRSERLPEVDVWLIIDILRATTVMVSWFAAGGEELYPAASARAARELAESLRREGKSPLLMGERNAVAPEGFDLGNSPLDITPELAREHPCAVMATTNGTKAILKAASTGAPVFAACARNAPAALGAALARGNRVGILCSGREERPSWDDALCAGLLIACLKEYFPEIRLTDGARLAHLTWLTSKDFKSSLRSADHAVFLEKIGYGGDLDFAAEIGVTHVVPELRETSSDSPRVVLRRAESGAKPLPTSWSYEKHENMIGDSK